MKPKRLAAALVLCVSGVLLSASCLQATPGADATAPSAPSNERADADEPIGEARQATGTPFTVKDFPFHVWVADDGEGSAGGWQQTEKTLHFVERDWGFPVYYWSCPLQIDVAIRSEEYGTISPRFASLCTAEVANDVVDPLLESQAAWRNQGAAFCYELEQRMLAEFHHKYHGLGARVHRPR